MRTSAAFALPVLLLAGGCGGAQPAARPEDTMLRQNARAAGLAFSLNRPEQAITRYQQALERARASDDAVAIGDYGYDLVVVQLAANRPKEALASARMTRAELARRNAVSFPALDLAEATALYRLADKAGSDRLAERVEAGSDAAAASRASFLRGLIADDTDNAVGLDEALARLVHPRSADEQGDASELVARQDLRRGSFKAAIGEAEHSADVRRGLLDYRGMARALSVAAVAEYRAGDRPAAAELYLRAGQSAAVQGDTVSARTWLRRVTELGSDPALLEAARVALTSVEKSSASE
jgi:hypothetical protein